MTVLPQGSEVTSVAQAEVVVLVDQGGHAYRGYLAVKGGVVGAIVHGAAGVETCFTRISSSNGHVSHRQQDQIGSRRKPCLLVSK